MEDPQILQISQEFINHYRTLQTQGTLLMTRADFRAEYPAKFCNRFQLTNERKQGGGGSLSHPSYSFQIAVFAFMITVKRQQSLWLI
jgi:hypothetical protein